MKKRITFLNIFIIIVTVFFVMDVKANIKLQLGESESAGGTADYCDSYTLTRTIELIKVERYHNRNFSGSHNFYIKTEYNNNPLVNNTFYYPSPTHNKAYSGEPINTLDLEGSGFNGVISNDGTVNVEFDTFINGLNNKNQVNNLISPFADDIGLSAEQFLREYGYDEFLIKPYFKISTCTGTYSKQIGKFCAPGKNKGVTGEGTDVALINGSYYKCTEYINVTPISGYYLSQDLVNLLLELDEQNPDTLKAFPVSSSAPDGFNLLYNAYINNEDYNYLYSQSDLNLNVLNHPNIAPYLSGKNRGYFKDYNEWKNEANLLNSFKAGYGQWYIQVDKIKKNRCNYNEPSHFEANKNGTATDTTGSGPYGENCCQYFNDNPGEIPDGALFWYDHPECFTNTKVTDETKKAICNNSTETTYKINDSNPWEKIFASIYHGSTDGSNKRYVKKIFNNSCQLLCYEDLTINFPNAYKSIVQAGGNFIWPDIANSNYKLSVQDNVTCKVYVDRYSNQNANTCKNAAIKYIKDKFSLNGNFTMDYNVDEVEKKYNAKNKNLNLYTLEPIKFNNQTDIKKDYTIDNISGLEIKFSQVAFYTTPDYYGYSNSQEYSPTEKFNFLKLSQGVIPNSLTKSNKESVRINYDRVGGFPEKIDFVNASYTCPYNIDAPSKNDEYCPDFYTPYGGWLLSDALKKCPNLTEADALDAICSGNQVDEELTCSKLYTNPDHPDEVVATIATIKDCGEITVYKRDYEKECFDDITKLPSCPYGTARAGEKFKLDGSPIDEACLNDNSCVNENCNYPDGDQDACPPGTKHEYDLLNKYQGKINYYMQSEGLSVEEAITKACNAEEKIVYRTISLDNPFPGKDGSGRNPGLNWYGKVYFQDDIIINGVLLSRNNISGNDLYAETVTPMYTINLTPATINAIRQYNNTHGYNNDDTNTSSITCMKNANTGSKNIGCQSDFLHNPSKYMEGITTLIDTNNSTCNELYKNIDDFESCAN